MSTQYTVVTYTVRDTTGGIRGQGIQTLDDAETLAQKVCDESTMPISCEIERVTFTGARTIETVKTVAKVTA